MKKLVPIIIVILAVILCLSCFMIMKDKSESKAEKDAFDQLTQIVEIDEAEQKDTEPDVLKKRDLTPLVEENPDCVGWIYIEGTEVDYPVMHTPNAPQKYLRLSYEGESSTAGVPFLQETCSVEGDNLIVYGHNMRNGSMFATVAEYADASYCQAHPVIEFETVNGLKYYQVYVVALVKSNDSWYSFTTADNMEEYETAMNGLHGSIINETDAEPEYGKQLLTLSTCYGSEDDDRLIVVAVEE